MGKLLHEWINKALVIRYYITLLLEVNNKSTVKTSAQKLREKIQLQDWAAEKLRKTGDPASYEVLL